MGANYIFFIKKFRHPEFISGSHPAMKTSYVYILSNKYRTAFYVGVTFSLSKRIAEHKSGKGSNFTKKYNVNDLLYYEEYSDITQAISREKQIKNWRKEWKINLIKSLNPSLKTVDLPLI